jgi:hypothetical protein
VHLHNSCIAGKTMTKDCVQRALGATFRRANAHLGNNGIDKACGSFN